MLPNVIDGFALNSGLLFLPKRWFPNALAQLDVLRRAANYRPRWYCVPDGINFTEAIAAYSTLQFQVQVVPGSYLLGFNWFVLDGELSDFWIQVTDSCTEIPLSSDFQSGAGFRPSGASQLWPRLLGQPRLILEPGLLNVELANTTASARQCQLLLHFAEPCQEIERQTGIPACSR